MISAVSHRLQLSGNKFIVSCFMLISILSMIHCATKKRSSSDYTKKNHPPKVEEKKPVKVDTVVWKEIPSKNSKSTDPNKNDSNLPKQQSKGKVQKEADVYRLIALIPFKANLADTSSAKLNSTSLRYVHFYAGMKMAIDEFEKDSGKKILVDVYDCESITEATEVLNKYDNKPPHLIIGPQKVEALKYVADWAKMHETTVLSPWVSSSSISEANPYYVQTKAGLSAHYQNINEHARSRYPAENIYLISKGEDESKSKNFNDSTKRKNITEKVIKESDLANGVDPIITPLLKEEGPTVFILPLASNKDENYIYHFLRRAASEKTNKEIIVYGTYKWLEMRSEIIDYLNVYKIRLSISNYFDQDNYSIKSFKKKYFEKYREFPSQDVLEGYDVMKYSIKGLRALGPDFHMRNSVVEANYLETSFDIQPVRKSKTAKDSDPIDYFENNYIKMVELRNNRYRIVE